MVLAHTGPRDSRRIHGQTGTYALRRAGCWRMATSYLPKAMAEKLSLTCQLPLGTTGCRAPSPSHKSTHTGEWAQSMHC